MDYLEYNSTISISFTGTSIASLVGNDLTVPLSASLSDSNHSGTNLPLVASSTSLYLAQDFDFSLISITSPALTKYEGMFTHLPLTSTCLWSTICHSSFLVLAKPNLKITLSSLSSRVIIRFSPVIPFCFSAFL